jgi:hypothetical protein
VTDDQIAAGKLTKANVSTTVQTEAPRRTVAEGVEADCRTGTTARLARRYRNFMLLYPLQAGPTFVGMHRLLLPKEHQAGND